MLVAALLASGCGSRERQAERLHRKATQAVKDGNIEEAAAIFTQIVEEYPETEVAAKAREAVKLYPGLAGADQHYPTFKARDLMVITARGIERYKSRNRKLPEGLGALVPGYIDVEPVDPWGRTLIYHLRSGGRSYALTCWGSDGAPGGSGEASDIVIHDGRFVKRGDAP